MMAIYFSAEYFGYLTPIQMLADYDLDTEPDDNAVIPYLFLFGVIFIGFAITDGWVFVYSPL